jgi:hypothetical protein
MKELLANLLAGVLESVGESKLEDALQLLHDKHPEQWQVAVRGGYSLVTALQPFAASTANKIDDAVLKSLGEALQASATKNGITL